jgi:hypothetical protein
MMVSIGKVPVFLKCTRPVQFARHRGLDGRMGEGIYEAVAGRYHAHFARGSSTYLACTRAPR